MSDKIRQVWTCGEHQHESAKAAEECAETTAQIERQVQAARELDDAYHYGATYLTDEERAGVLRILTEARKRGGE